jgi:hypothetical protein
MNRALAYDGLLAAKVGDTATEKGLTPDDIRVVKAYAEESHPSDTPFDIVWEGQTPDDPEEAASIVRPYAEAGATWWIESQWTPPYEPDDLRFRIDRGPPCIE